MRTMYDAVTARNIPTTAAMVAGYIDKIKLEPWSAADWARFPNAVKVTIVKKASTNDGHVLDVEPGDATPAQAPGWVRMRRAAGADPTVYMNASTWPSVRAEFDRQGVAQPHYWVAKYDNDPAWGAGWAALGCVAKQYAGDVAPGIDLSSVAAYWPGVDNQEEDVDLKDVVPQWKGIQGTYTVENCLAGVIGHGTNMDTKITALTGTVNQLATAVAKVNGVTAEQLAAALAPALLPDLLAAVKDELKDVDGLDETAVVQKLTDVLNAGLGR